MTDDENDIIKDAPGDDTGEMDVIKDIWGTPTLDPGRSGGPGEDLFQTDIFGAPAPGKSDQAPIREEKVEEIEDIAMPAAPAEEAPVPASAPASAPAHDDIEIVELGSLPEEPKPAAAEAVEPAREEVEEITLQTSEERAYLSGHHPEIDTAMDSLALEQESRPLVEKLPAGEDKPADKEIKVVTDDDLRQLFSQASLGPGAAGAPKPAPDITREEKHDVLGEIVDKLDNLEHEVEVGEFQAVGAAKKGAALQKAREQIESLETIGQDFLSVQTLSKMFSNVNTLIELIKDFNTRLEALEEKLDKYLDK